MKYYRFHEPDTGEGEYLHYMRPEEAYVLIDVHFIRPGQTATANAEVYKQRYSHNVADDFVICMRREDDGSSQMDEFIIRCMAVFGYKNIEVIESDKVLDGIYRFDVDKNDWVPDAAEE